MLNHVLLDKIPGLYQQLFMIYGRFSALLYKHNCLTYIHCINMSSKSLDTQAFNCHDHSWVVRFIDVYLFYFIYCYLYSAFSIVQCSNALYRL